MSNRKVFKLSLIAAACMAASAPVFAGQIIGIQQAAPSPQFTDPADEYKNGFGGWNLDNANVKIVNIDTGVDVAGKAYNPADGSYTPMVVGEGFVSELTDGAATPVVMGTLHGKDWPKGEPSGVKVITRTDLAIDAVQPNAKPVNCIMSTSYHAFSEEIEEDPSYILPAGASPEDGVLGSAYLNPTLCESPFQTHKRFKVKALPTTIDGSGRGVDMVFNVDATAAETGTRDYEVLQKLNNYTDKRLSGYKIEVGFGVGTSFVNASGSGADLRLSIGTGENLLKTPGNPTDIWAADDLAKFSAGLFGLADEHHLTDGFFSNSTAYYPVELDATATTITSTGVLTTNYTQRFGNWLPGGWETSGIFYDGDMNPATDNELKAFWGLDTDGSYKWLQGQAAGFAPATDTQLSTWANNTSMPDGTSQYTVAKIDDMLNLGLTYIVKVGDVTTFPADNFTVRMTPIADATDDGTAPGWIANAAPTTILPTSSTSSGGSASVMDNAGTIVAILAFLGLGGWLVRRKLAAE